MAMIKFGKLDFGHKKLRVLIEGHEDENGEFIKDEVWVNHMDIENIGLFDAYQEKAE